jgi:Fic family protein
VIIATYYYHLLSLLLRLSRRYKLHSLDSAFLDKILLSSASASTLRELGAFQGRQELFKRQAPEVLLDLVKAAIIESSESSNRLEGVTAPRERIAALVLKPAEPRNRSEQEIAGYRDSLNLIHESAMEMALTVNVMLQLHSMLYRYHPGGGGRFKMTQNEIIERSHDGSIRVRFTPVTPVATSGAMEELARRYAAAADSQREPLVLIPLTVLDFLCIHPFTDGNGRVGRLITLMLLYHSGHDVGRYISLERVIEESKETYYEALEASSRGWHSAAHDPLPWMSYFWGVVLRAYREFEKRVGTIRGGRGGKTEMVEAAVARRLRPFGIADIEAECPGVSREMVRHVLRGLRADGRLELRGQGRGAQWVPLDG